MLKNKTDLINGACEYLIKTQVGDDKLWSLLLKQIAEKRDKRYHYRGEYWGKVMRGATLIYRYTQNEELYRTLEKTVREMVALCAEDGIHSYADDCQFTAWDIWCRKYVAVGLEYFYAICRSDKLKEDILDCLKKHLTAIMRAIGNGPQQKDICAASDNWGGLNSCSILKAYVVAYELTGEKKFLDFATYIVSTGGSKDFDFLQAAKEDKIPLCGYRYPKSYEATSFFEGLLEYGKITGDEEILRACQNYARAILKQEFTVVGSGGCAVECFNYSVVTQTYPRVKPLQETCVTVSYLLYFEEIYKLTGDAIYLDAMEKAFYNAYLGALNETHPHKTGGLPIDWYSPLVGGTRANVCVAGRQMLTGINYYSCCTAIGPAGAGLIGCRKTETDDRSVRFIFYENGIVRIGATVITEKTEYPFSGKVGFTFSGEKTKLDLYFRIPGWCSEHSLSINGTATGTKCEKGFVSVSGTFGEGDEIVLIMNMPYRFDYIASARFRGGFLVFSKGPIVYAADRRFTRIFTPFPLRDQHDPRYDFCFTPKKIDGVMDAVVVRCKNKKITLVDYASAGGTYDIVSTVNVFVPYRTGSPLNVLSCFLDRRKKIRG